MTRRTFIAFLTALLPANWLRRSAHSEPRKTYLPTTYYHPAPPKYQRVNLLTGLPQTEAERVAEVRRFIARRMGRDLLGEPITNIPGLCDLAYRKP